MDTHTRKVIHGAGWISICGTWTMIIVVARERFQKSLRLPTTPIGHRSLAHICASSSSLHRIPSAVITHIDTVHALCNTHETPFFSIIACCCCSFFQCQLLIAASTRVVSQQFLLLLLLVTRVPVRRVSDFLSDNQST